MKKRLNTGLKRIASLIMIGLFIVNIYQIHTTAAEIETTQEKEDTFIESAKEDNATDITISETNSEEEIKDSGETEEFCKQEIIIRVQNKLEIEYSRKTDNQLIFEIAGENLDQSQIACTITAEDPSIIEIDNNGKYRTLKGGSTNLTITADDSTEDDIYEKKTVTVPVTVLSPSNTDYTLNNRTPKEFMDNPDAVIIGENNTKERWYDKDITLRFGDDNLYDELYYSTDSGKHWTHVNGREFVIRESMPTDYLFYFCDTEANIYSCIMNNDAVTAGKLEFMGGIAVDTTKPIWNTALMIDKEPGVHSNDRISYFSTEVTVTAYAGQQQGSGQIVDAGSGIHKVYAQYGNSGSWEEVQELTGNERYCDSYAVTLHDDRDYGTVKLKAVDYLGHESETAEYVKEVCIDSQNPIIVAIPVDAVGKETNYSGNWTNRQLQYRIGLQNDREQISGIYRYEYAFIPRGQTIDLSKAEWNEVSPKDLMLEFGDGAHINGTLFVKGESNAGLVTTSKDIQDNHQEIRIWQEELDAPKVTISNQCDPTTGWYNKKTGPVSISFEYPDYDQKNYAPPVGIVYTLRTQMDDAEPSLSRTSRFYQGIINESSGKVIEVSDYHDENSLVSLAQDGIINIDTDGINTLTVYVEDAAGNRSDSKVFEIKADYTEPQNIKATVDGELYQVHQDGKESCMYKKFSQNTVSVNAEAEYGISKKQNFYMAVTKDQGGKAELSPENVKDSLNMEACSRGLVYLCAVDGAGNKAEAWTDGIVVDNLAPTGIGQQEISVEAKGVNREGFYNKDVEISLRVADAPAGDNYSGLKNVTYTLGKEGQDTESNVTVLDSQTLALSWDTIENNHSFEKNHIVIDAVQNESNRAYMKVTATDYAGNSSTITKEFRIDITKPQIEVSFDNNNSTNGRYYNNSRTARIDITELNFDPKQVTFRIYRDGKEDNTVIPAMMNWEKTEESVHTAYITFEEDGDYYFEVQCTDLAGNESEKTITDTFTIDKTKPVVEVAYDYNNARKDNYYNRARTATITVTEHNFDEKDFEIVTRPQVISGAWIHEGDVHRISVYFDQEENYSYTLRCTDLAGNQIDTFEEEKFCIDKSTPVIQILGVENRSANRGVVIPVVTVTDANYDREGIQINLQNSKGEQIAVSHDEVQKDNGYSYTLTNVNEQLDEIYNLSVQAVDMAGNESELVYRFSLNRNGSVYDLSRIADIEARKYVRYKDLQDLQVYEMNVNTIEEFQMIVTRNGEMIQSVETNTRPRSIKENNVCYTTKMEGNDEIGYQYEYTLYKESFTQEGIYNIIFYSKDQAGNEVNNTLTEKKAEITFVVDNSIPTVIIEGAETGEIYTEETRNVNVYVADNFKLQKAYFYLVDEDGNIIQTYDYMDLVEQEGEIATLSLPGSNKKMTLQYYAMDEAGNEITTMQERKTAAGFRITTNAWTRYIYNKKAVVVSVFLTTGIVILAIVFVKRRRKS